MALNTIATIRRWLMIETGNDALTDDEITTYLDEADQFLYNEIHKKYEVDRFRAGYDEYSGAVETKYEIRMKPVDSIYKVYKEGVELLTTDYTYDSELYQITMIADVEASDYIEIFYTPTAYSEAALFVCLTNIGTSTNLISADGAATLEEKFKPKMEKAIKKIKNRMKGGVYSY